MATSKQARKEPLTTIGVNQSTIALLDEYLADKNLSRKEFVEKAIKYFIKTGFDLNENLSQLSPVQNAVADLKEMQEKTEEQNKVVMNILTNLFDMQKTYVQKALPAQEKAKDGEEYKTRYKKIKATLLLLAENKCSVRVGQIKRVISEYMDL